MEEDNPKEVIDEQDIEETGKIHDLKTMSNKELLRYYEGLKSTNKHLMSLFMEKKIKNSPTIDWLEAFRKRDEWLDEVRMEILIRMDGE